MVGIVKRYLEKYNEWKKERELKKKNYFLERMTPSQIDYYIKTRSRKNIIPIIIPVCSISKKNDGAEIGLNKSILEKFLEKNAIKMGIMIAPTTSFFSFYTISGNRIDKNSLEQWAISASEISKGLNRIGFKNLIFLTFSEHVLFNEMITKISGEFHRIDALSSLIDLHLILIKNLQQGKKEIEVTRELEQYKY